MWVLLSMLFWRAAWGTIPLLILKSSRSGSAWMTTQLNTYKGVFVTEELLRGHSYMWGNAWKEGQAYLEKSFSAPQRIYGMEWSDKIKKPEEDFTVLGATLDALYVDQYVNWTETGVKFPDLKLVLYLRTNIVKHSVSILRKTAMEAKCGRNHIVADSSCELDKKFHINLKSLGRWIVRTIAIDDFSIETASALAQHLDSWFYILNYEELLLDEEAAFHRLFEWIGYEPKERAVPVDGRCRNNCTKATSDDLRNVIINYDEVESYLLITFPCLLSHLRETNPGEVMHSAHMSCASSLFDPMGKEFIQKKKHLYKVQREEWEAGRSEFIKKQRALFHSKQE